MSLDSLWDFDRPEVSESRFREALADASGEEGLVLRTQLARSLGLQNSFDECSAELDSVDAAVASADPAVTPLVRIHLALERGRQLRSSGQGEQSDPRARRWIGSVANNLGWTLHEAGRFDDAQIQFVRALRAREEQGEAEPIRIGRWTVARGLRSLGRHEEALAIQWELRATGPEDGYVEEELAEVLLALGRTEEAGPHFARAYALLSADAWLAESEPDRLARLRDLAA